MSELSANAEAILDAYYAAPTDEKLFLAAILRAIADQVVPEEAPEPTGMRPCGDTFSARWIMRAERVKMRKQLFAIAAELEGQ